jgi:hypothetical protein
MRRLRIVEAAAEEAVEAAAWYERQRAGLGADFERAVNAALDLLEDDIVPLAMISVGAGTRGLKRLTLKRFPFDVVVIESGDELIVVAFAHQARRPGYWRARVRD